jgi:hypothetical protein
LGVVKSNVDGVNALDPVRISKLPFSTHARLTARVLDSKQKQNAAREKALIDGLSRFWPRYGDEWRVTCRSQVTMR